MSSYISWTKNPTPRSLGESLGAFCVTLLYIKKHLNQSVAIVGTTCAITTSTTPSTTPGVHGDVLRFSMSKLGEHGEHGDVLRFSMSPTGVFSGFPTEMFSGSPTYMFFCSPTEVLPGSPTQMFSGSPTEVPYWPDTLLSTRWLKSHLKTSEGEKQAYFCWFLNKDIHCMFFEGKPRTVFFLQKLYLRYLSRQLKKSNIRAGRTWSWVSSGSCKQKDYSLTSERKFSKKDPPIPGVLWKPYLDFYCMYHTYVFLNKKYENGKQSHPHALLLSKISFFFKERFLLTLSAYLQSLSRQTPLLFVFVKRCRVRHGRNVDLNFGKYRHSLVEY